MELVKATQEDAEEFNPSSVQQLQQLLYAPFKRVKKMTKPENNDPALSNLEFATENESNGSSGEEEVYGDAEPKRKVTRNEPDDFPEFRAFTVPNTKVFYYSVFVIKHIRELYFQVKKLP